MFQLICTPQSIEQVMFQSKDKPEAIPIILLKIKKEKTSLKTYLPMQGQQVLSGGKGAVVGPHQQPQQAHLLTAEPSVSAAETNHSYTNIAGIVGIEQQQHSARVMPPDYPLYEVPYQDQQVQANYQYSTTHYQQVWLISI